MRNSTLIGLLSLVLATRAGATPIQHEPTYWESVGFGLVLEMRGELVRLHETTPPLGSILALQTRLEKRRGNLFDLVSRNDNEWADEGEPIGTLRFDDQHLYLRRPGTLDDIVCERLPARPAVLELYPDGSPPAVFEYFRLTVEAHHAFLQERLEALAIPAGQAPEGATWSELCDAAAKEIGPDTPRAELCAVMWGLLEPLGDAHTYLYDPADDDSDFDGWHPDTYATMRPGVAPAEVDEDSIEADVERAFDIVDTRYLDATSGLHSIANEEIEFGMLADVPILYMRILSFSHFIPRHDFPAELRRLQRDLDEVVEYYREHSAKAVIIDLRSNGGGSDALGIEIASRFNKAPYVAFVEDARGDPGAQDSYTPAQAMRVPVTKRLSMREAPLALLTGPLSISAAETFAMAFMERGPDEQPVLRVGERTQGVYADVHTRLLPNDMVIGIPNERYLSSTGDCYEIGGIPPHVPVPVFAPEDLDEQRDPALERAADELLKLL